MSKFESSAAPRPTPIPPSPQIPNRIPLVPIPPENDNAIRESAIESTETLRSGQSRVSEIALRRINRAPAAEQSNSHQDPMRAATEATAKFHAIMHIAQRDGEMEPNLRQEAIDDLRNARALLEAKHAALQTSGQESQINRHEANKQEVQRNRELLQRVESMLETLNKEPQEALDEYNKQIDQSLIEVKQKTGMDVLEKRMEERDRLSERLLTEYGIDTDRVDAGLPKSIGDRFKLWLSGLTGSKDLLDQWRKANQAIEEYHEDLRRQSNQHLSQQERKEIKKIEKKYVKSNGTVFREAGRDLASALLPVESAHGVEMQRAEKRRELTHAEQERLETDYRHKNDLLKDENDFWSDAAHHEELNKKQGEPTRREELMEFDTDDQPVTEVLARPSAVENRVKERIETLQQKVEWANKILGGRAAALWDETFQKMQKGGELKTLKETKDVFGFTPTDYVLKTAEAQEASDVWKKSVQAYEVWKTKSPHAYKSAESKRGSKSTAPELKKLMQFESDIEATKGDYNDLILDLSAWDKKIVHTNNEREEQHQAEVSAALKEARLKKQKEEQDYQAEVSGALQQGRLKKQKEKDTQEFALAAAKEKTRAENLATEKPYEEAQEKELGSKFGPGAIPLHRRTREMTQAKTEALIPDYDELVGLLGKVQPASLQKLMEKNNLTQFNVADGKKNYLFAVARYLEAKRNGDDSHVKQLSDKILKINKVLGIDKEHLVRLIMET